MAQNSDHSNADVSGNHEAEIGILVTGGSGLVGRALQWAISESSFEEEDARFQKRPNEKWTFLTSADGDLRDLTATRAIFTRCRPHVVIHLAARVGGVFANMAHQADFFSDNLDMNQNVLRVCHEFDVGKVISCLSTCIFPNATTYPINETMLHDGPPHDSNFGYAYAKRMLDVANRAYASQYGRKFTGIVPTNIYGPHDNFGDGSHFVPALIRRVHAAKEFNSLSVQVAGSGAALRQFIYSRDVAKILIWMTREYDSSDPIILAGKPQRHLQLWQVLSSMRRSFEFSARRLMFAMCTQWDTSKTDGQLRKTADNTKLKTYLKDFQFTPFEQGVKETIGWFVENKDGGGCRL
ncbi:hypothetical protein B0H63DRAFT_431970 [Podospora didyma]|uniref:GDP-L-fucose synthase n=1 Tax=Podospora didyma TaxID=330526 RepID=A0AAE0U2A3_9PEZI|nr:hypothetical protein B0H63DRAFT_431970 [Podospora didyma]